MTTTSTAELQGVTVFNINELANAIKSVYCWRSLAHQHHAGARSRQGVGYMEDNHGVVENGKEYIGEYMM